LAKILKITHETVTIGVSPKEVIEVPLNAIDFRISVGDEVDVHQSGTDVYVTQRLEDTQGKAVNKIAYIVLALFLGSLGVHHFYAGKTTKGIIYIVFCWTFIPGFLALFSFISALFKKADANGNIRV